MMTEDCCGCGKGTTEETFQEGISATSNRTRLYSAIRATTPSSTSSSTTPAKVSTTFNIVFVVVRLTGLFIPRIQHVNDNDVLSASIVRVNRLRQQFRGRLRVSVLGERGTMCPQSVLDDTQLPQGVHAMWRHRPAYVNLTNNSNPLRVYRKFLK